ncbi:cold shock domain-containing protein [Aeromonas salmonicida]|uniref:cold shock domain-containing protein n=1 Tax=Aeromonas salmonicida TaxID=645 RepID=UPI0023304C6C|nr:cold shock domain-containing protein [Aeromonas salmonicida]WCH28290.1 cold shock domain-containing protein [Aeromonas salmonicida]
MRYQGRIASWNEARGFGFITPEQEGGEQQGSELFVHISALQSDGSRPNVGERVSYQLGTGKDDKPRAVQVFFPDRPLSLADGFNPPSASPRLGRETSTRSPQPASPRPGSRPRPAYRHKSSWRGKVIPLLLVVGLFSLYSLFSTDSVVPLPVSSFIGDEGSASRSTPQTSARRYQCDGREYCSQMTSCEEATWFLRHCPNTKMDGEGDGVPCERQWCGH